VAPASSRKAFAAMRRYAKYGSCWAPGDFEARRFAPENCCHRPFLDVDIVVVGLVRAAVLSLAGLLSVHPEIVTSPVEHDVLTNLAPVDEEHIFEFNMFVRMLRASKPGSKLVAFVYPWMMMSQLRMFRLAQVPNVKVVVALHEPTSWLAHVYNDDLARCSRACDALPTVEQFLLRGTVPNSEWTVGHGHSLPEILHGYVHLQFPLSSVAYVDSGMLEHHSEDGLTTLGSLLHFFGVADQQLDTGALELHLGRSLRDREGPKAPAAACQGPRGVREWVNSLFSRARRRLRARLANYSRAGSFVAVAGGLFRGPC